MVARKSVWPGRITRIDEEPGEEEERDPGRPERLVQAPEPVGQLAVGGHRVRDPRGADDARVRGDDEDRRGEDPDVDLERAEERAVDPEVVDETEHRVVGEAALLRRQAEHRLVLAARERTGIAESAIAGSVK